MAKSTFAELQAQVSGLVANGATLSANTIPTLDNVKQWLNDAQVDIARKMPGPYLDTLLKVIDPSIGAVSSYDLSGTTDLCKSYMATLNVDGSGEDVPIDIVSKEKAIKLSRSSLNGLTDSPIGWFEGGKFYWFPATQGIAASGKLKLTYVALPTKLSGDSDTSDLREIYEQPMVYRTCAKHYLNEEEIQVYLQFQGVYMNLLQEIKNEILNGR